MNSVVQSLKLTTLAHHINTEDLDILASYVRKVVFRADTLLYRSGSPAEALYIIFHGRVELTHQDEKDNRVVDARLTNGDFFGERALLDGAENDLTAICLDDTTFYVLELNQYRKLRNQHPRIAAKLLGLLSEKMRQHLAGQAAYHSSCPKIVTFFSGKDGVGKSFLAANFAAVAAKQCKARVSLVELDLQFGNIDVFLGIHPAKTIWDIVSNEELDKVSSKLLRDYSTEVLPGLDVYTRPKSITEAESIEAKHITALIDHLQRISDLVVVDCSAGFNESSLSVLDVSDCIYLVSTADLGGVVVTRNTIEVLDRLGYRTGKVKVIVNRSMPGRDLPEENKKHLFEDVSAAIIPEDNTAWTTLNDTKLLTEALPSHYIVRTLTNLAREFVTPKMGDGEESKFSFLQRWLHWFDSRQQSGGKHIGDSEVDNTVQEKRSALAEFSLGQAHYLVGSYDVARRAFERALDEYSALAVGHFYLGEIALFDGDYAAAQYHFQAAHQYRPKSLHYRVRLSLLSATPAGMLRELDLVEKAVNKHPEFADLRLLLARVHQTIGNQDKCILQLNKALEENARYLDALTLKGRILREAKRLNEALATLAQAVKFRNTHIPALYELGLVFCELQLPALARQYFDSVLDVYGEHRLSHQAIIDLQSPLRSLRREVDRYGEAARLHPSFGDFPFKLAVARYQLGEFKHAQDELSKAKKAKYDTAKVDSLQERLASVVPLVEKLMATMDSE